MKMQINKQLGGVEPMTLDELIKKLIELQKQGAGANNVYVHDSELEAVSITVVYPESENIYIG